MNTEMERYDGGGLQGAPAWTPDRDTASEIRQRIDQAAADAGDVYHARVMAQELLAKLKIDAPELLEMWLHQQAEHLLYQAIVARDRVLRAGQRKRKVTAAFSAAVRAAGAGNTDALSGWLSTPFTAADNLRKPLGKMTRDDLLYAAQGYQRRAELNMLTGTFLRVLAKRLAAGEMVEQKFTETDLMQMWGGVQDSDSD